MIVKLQFIQDFAEKVKENMRQVVVGNEQVVEQLLVALIASGHVLLEDVPGMGKTLIAKTVAKSLDCTFSRIQFTPDLLPADLTGINYFNQKKSEFEFRPGPVFSNIVLADEINRATPRTQSSLLECMGERQVSIDGVTRPLERPFIVIATQNPVESQGTFPLPEAQLDRFLLKIKMGYPSREEGIEIMKRFKQHDPLKTIKPVVNAEEIIAAQEAYAEVFVHDDMYQYMLDIVEKTRKYESVALGISPRGSQALLKAVQVWAILQGRDYVLPDDVKAMIKPVFAHRLLLKSANRLQEGETDRVLEHILTTVEVPAEENLSQKVG